MSKIGNAVKKKPPVSAKVKQETRSLNSLSGLTVAILTSRSRGDFRTETLSAMERPFKYQFTSTLPHLKAMDNIIPLINGPMGNRPFLCTRIV